MRGFSSFQVMSPFQNSSHKWNCFIRLSGQSAADIVSESINVVDPISFPSRWNVSEESPGTS
jgi:hypothetical protein